MPDVLDVVVVLQHVDELGHVLQVALAAEVDVVLGHHLHLGADEGVSLGLQSLHHVVEGVGIGGDLQGGTVGLEVLGWFFRNRRKAAEEEAVKNDRPPDCR